MDASAPLHPEDRAHGYDAFFEAFRERLPFRTEFRMRRHDGEYRWFFNHSVPRFSAAGDIPWIRRVLRRYHRTQAIRTSTLRQASQEVQQLKERLQEENAHLLAELTGVADEDAGEVVCRSEAMRPKCS